MCIRDRVEAKGLVDKVPSEIKKDVPAEEGAKLKETLEAAGMTSLTDHHCRIEV